VTAAERTHVLIAVRRFRVRVICVRGQPRRGPAEPHTCVQRPLAPADKTKKATPIYGGSSVLATCRRWRSNQIVLPRFNLQARVVSPAKTGFPLPPRAATASAATTSAPTATTTSATATAAASAATRFRRRCRCGYGKPGQSDSLEEVDSHHRYCRQDIRQGLQTYSTRHSSCHHQSLLANNASLDQHTPARQTHVSYRLPRPRLWRLKA